MSKIRLVLKKNKILYLILLFVQRKIKFLFFGGLNKRISDIFYALTFYDSYSLLTSCDMTIGIKYLACKNTNFPHPVGIVIGKNVKLGLNCTIYQNVTIGVKKHASESYPKIGNNVRIYSGACIVGDITLGDNVVIGAGSIIVTDVPPNCVVAGNPAKIIKFFDSNNMERGS